MEEQIKLCVTCGGETQTFLTCDSVKTTWADLEAMVKVSFDLNNVQIKYFDEDNEEVSINSAEEYEEFIKSAIKQGKQIQMNAYEINLKDKMENHTSKRTFENIELKGSQNKKAKKKEMKHHSQLAKVVGPEMKVSQEPKNKVLPKDANETKENWQLPPVWFTEYMEMLHLRQGIKQSDTPDTHYPLPIGVNDRISKQFKETFVRETVDRICCNFFEKVNIEQRVRHSPNGLVACPTQVPELQTTQVNCYDWLMTCSNCQSQIRGIRYQCSICPTYNICEACEAGDYRHDPNHALLKLRKALTSAEIIPIQFGNMQTNVAEQTRLQKQIDKTFLKAEKQRLRAEKRQRKAEFKEIKKQLKLQKKHLQWNGVHVMEQLSEPIQGPKGLQNTSTMPVVSTLSAEFVDENFPDGSHLQPAIKFIKQWRMKNTGTANWTSATKLQFMWGNLTQASSDKKEVSVPFLQPGEIGVVSVKFVAPESEGTYTSHWRLAHKGEQFGPRVWCSIVIDFPLPSGAANLTPDLKANSFLAPRARFPKNWEEVSLASETQDQPVPEEETTVMITTKKPFVTADSGKHPIALEIEEAEAAKTATIALPKLQHKDQNREFYTLMPSVDLLTAQDLLSFELLDINIVQEMEHVPNNTPVDMTPCMSPLPYDGPLIEKPGLVQIEEENEANFKSRLDHPHLEEGEEDISGTQFVCETVIRSLALDETPDLVPRRRGKADNTSQEMQEISSSAINNTECTADQITMTTGQTKLCTEIPQDKDNIESDAADDVSECFEEEKYEIESQGSSDCSEDYIIILPECFDTSRPLGDSMYSSALSQPEDEEEEEEEIEVVSDADVSENENAVSENKSQLHNINDIFCISQTLEMEPLKPEVLSAPLHEQRNDAGTLNSSEVHSDVPEMPEVENPPVNSTVHQQRNVSTAFEVECAEVPRTMNNQLQCPHLRHHSGIAGELVKGALSVAASAYKALFAGDTSVVQTIIFSQPNTSKNLSSIQTLAFVCFECLFSL
ncbi:NBR1 autophagy cargo receptor a isoform X3 [Hemitrygon akajei]|uniref:NBR1 autophagy cargo receptor a isoform X3 n=1 Tax=Hemitrygon akajei TaxID=2704970 RepID=UPI003BF97D94